MKKLKVFVAFGALCFLMSSCVYSLFPIYTEDTLVYLPELVGKWQIDPANEDNYIEFIPINEQKKKGTIYAEAEDTESSIASSKMEMNDDTDGDPETYSYIMQGKDWSIKSDDPITVKKNGKVIEDQAEVKAYYDSLFGTMNSDLEKGFGKMATQLDSAVRAEGSEFGKMMDDLGKGLGKLGKALKQATSKFKGTAYVSSEESYKMVVMENGKRTPYQVHVVEIGENYFLDIYPLPEYDENTFSDNLFPVHSFMKMDIENEELKLTLFDLEKLNELFESNLVRLRHEYVDGNVVITAQPTEIQKFLDRYSNDDSVFEEAEIYTKAVL